MSAWLKENGQINVYGITDETVDEQADLCLSYCLDLVSKALKCPDHSWVGVVVPIEKAKATLSSFINAISWLYETGHCDRESEVAVNAQSELISFLEKITLDKKVNEALQNVLNSGLPASKKRELELVISEHIDARKMNSKKIKKWEQESNVETDYYSVNISNSKRNYWLSVVDLDKHMDDNYGSRQFLRNAKRKAAQLNQEVGTFTFNLEDANYMAMMTYCQDRSIRREVYKHYVSVASYGDDNNIPILVNIVKKRQKLAKELGEKNFLELATKKCGLRGNEVKDFLDFVSKGYIDKNNKYKEALKEFASNNLGINRVDFWDTEFVSSKFKKVMEKQAGIDNFKINFDKALSAVFAKSNEVFGISFDDKFIEHNTAQGQIREYSARDADGEYLGAVFLDLFAREGKVSGMEYNLTISNNIKFGRSSMPSINMVNMCLHGDWVSRGESMSLMSAVTLFHEFGHVLHSLITKSKTTISGSNSIQPDALEFPSIWFERFAKTTEFIQMAGTINNKKISLEKAKDIIEIFDFQSPNINCSTALLARMDVQLNAGSKIKCKDSIYESIKPIFDEYNTKLTKYDQSNVAQFEHFMALKSLYYSYVWSEHLVREWDRVLGNKPLVEQGDIMKALLTKSVGGSANFTDVFKKLVCDPYSHKAKKQGISRHHS